LRLISSISRAATHSKPTCIGKSGGEIKFKRYGGVIGIEKDLVRVIEEVEELPKEKEKAEQANQGLSEAARKVGAGEFGCLTLVL